MRIALLVGVLGACSFDGAPSPGAPDPAAPDGGTSSPPDGSAPQLGPWSTPIAIAELDSGTGDDDPSLTADLLEIYFGSKVLGAADEDVYYAKRASVDAPWSAPMLVPNVNGATADTTGRVSASGLELYFSSSRQNSDYAVYRAVRAARSEDFGAPKIVEFSDNNIDEWGAYPRADLLRLVLCRGANVAAEAIYVSERANLDAAWGAPAKLAELDEPNISECDPVEPHPLAIYFASNRTGDYDTYVARRASQTDPYGPPEPAEGINVVGASDRDAWVSADERTMVFASNRDGIERLYMSTR